MASPDTSSLSPMDSKTATAEAIERLCASHLHRCFWLPENASHGRLRFTYSTTSNFEDTSLPVILFCNPMFGSRWINVAFERWAKASGVRVIDIDRPGMGGSTRVSEKIRMQTWLEAVPVALELLKVKHVSIVCHSAGTMYLLTTLYHLRNILDPQRPFVGIIAPWVHNEHSKMTLWNVVSKLPVGVFSSWNSVAGFINNHIAPSVAWSGGVISSVSGIFKESTEAVDPPGERYGTSEEVGKIVEKLQQKYFFAEDTTAGNEEAKLCLKKGDLATWGICDSFEDYVDSFCALERERKAADPSLPKVTIRAYFAASDIMIGKGGQEYFNKCWTKNGVDEFVDYQTKELPDTDHDSALVQKDGGAIKKIFAEIGSDLRIT